MKLKKLLTITSSFAILASASMPIITSCGNKNSTEKEAQEFYEKLTKMPYVTKVEKLTTPEGYIGKYMVWFKQPIDWNDQARGSFNQRVEIWYKGKSKLNEFAMGGYDLHDLAANRKNDIEIAEHYNGNVIRPECRYFNKSRPDGLDNTKTDLWEFFNDDQISEDYNNMIKSFKTILSGKWVVSGTSRGGQSTNYLAMQHPEVADAFVPYVAPAFFVREDAIEGGEQDLFYERIYQYIGNGAYGVDKAKEYRKEVSKFQYYCYVNKGNGTSDNKMLQKYNESISEDWQFTDLAKSNHFTILYDVAVNEFSTAFWQYDTDINRLKSVNAMTDGQEKINAAAELLSDEVCADQWAYNDLSWPYEVASAIDQGEHGLMTKPMIDAMIENEVITQASDVTQYFSTYMQTESNQKGLLWRLVFTADQQSKWTFNSNGLYEKQRLDEWYSNSNQANVFMVYGTEDTWAKYMFNTTAKQPGNKIQLFAGDTLYSNDKGINPAWGVSHRCRISYLPEAKQQAVWDALDEAL